MSRFALRHLIFATTLVAAVGFIPSFARVTVRADEKVPDTASLKVWYNDVYSDYVLVELYFNGKLLRTRELKRPNVLPESTTFEKLAAGRYELHFEGDGYKKCIKRLALAPGDVDVEVHVQLFKDKERVIGGSSSLTELEKRMGELEKENAELKLEIEKLKKK